MKRKLNIIATTLGVCVFGGLVACAGHLDFTAESCIRTEFGRYYTSANGNIITADGNVWNYSAEYLDDAFRCSDGSVMFVGVKHAPKNNVPVWVRISDNGTPADITDDEILAVGLDFGIYMDERIAENDAFIASFQDK